MKPLQVMGSYEIVGFVSFESEQEVFYVDVDGFTFMLNTEDTQGVSLKKHQWVSFVVHDLLLYDENI
jgi:hypothetical protein